MSLARVLLWPARIYEPRPGGNRCRSRLHAVVHRSLPVAARNAAGNDLNEISDAVYSSSRKVFSLKLRLG